MKKVPLACLISFAFLFLSSIVTVALRTVFHDAPKEDAEGFVLIGLFAVVTVGLLYLILVKWTHLPRTPLDVICLSVNAVALGVMMTGWYVNRGFHNPLWMMALICLCSVAYLWVTYGIKQLPVLKNHSVFTTVALLLISLVGYVLLVIYTKTTYISTYGYYMIVEVAFFFAVCLPATDEKNLLSHMVVATYSVVTVAVLMLLIIGSGEVPDLDLDLGFGGEKKKKKQGK